MTEQDKPTTWERQVADTTALARATDSARNLWDGQHHYLVMPSGRVTEVPR